MRECTTAGVALCVTLFCLSAAVVNGRPGPRDDMLNVHLVSHTHDDVGWKKTVDEYYYGSNNSIQHAGVQYILDSVMPALIANPDRRFIYVEIAFFWRWWNEQTQEMQDEVKGLVANGQLEFINGGWCMNDEAATHYNGIIDQMTLGHTFLVNTFGVKPTVGWHIDPFGHSCTMATLMKEMNFDSFYFGRIDYQDKAERIASQTMELMWQASQSQGEELSIFTGVTYNLYQPPPGFNFDMLGSNQIPIQNDPELEGYNVQSRVDGFVEQCQLQAAAYTTNNIMLTMGSDFEYENANEWYTNLDLLIEYVNADGRVNAFYSTPSEYTKAVLSNGSNWQVKRNDFFPYAQLPWKYWTGYFTSRPALKAYIRESNTILQTCKQMEALAAAADMQWALNDTSSQLARRAVGVNQHHDAVTGTEQQHVADDYALRLAAGNAECSELTLNMLRTVAAIDGLNGTAPPFTVCPLLNVSACNASSDPAGGFSLLVYNPLAKTRTDFVRVPVSSKNLVVLDSNNNSVPAQIDPVSEATATVRGDRGDAPFSLTIQTNVLPMSYAMYFVLPATVGEDGEMAVPRGVRAVEHAYLRDLSPGDLASVATVTEVRAGGVAEVKQGASPTRGKHAEQATTATTPTAGEADDSSSGKQANTSISVTNGLVTLEFSTTTGLLTTMSTASVSAQVSQTFLWYNASVGNNANSTQPSDAYVFRPNSTTPYTVAFAYDAYCGASDECSALYEGSNPPTATLTVVNGSVCTEVRQVFGSWVSNVFRLCAGKTYAEAEYTIGPIPFQDGFGKEVISRYTTNINNGKTCFTDANGREMQNRTHNYREWYDLNVTGPVSGNYYPVDTAIRINDNNKALTILTDRSQGGASLWNGEVELMLHRRLFANNGGVNQVLNETGRTGKGLVTRGRHRLFLSPPSNASNEQRFGDEELTYAQAVYVGPASTPGIWATKYKGEWSMLSRALPPNVHLLTLETINTTQILLRLAHIFAVGESEEWSTPATVDLKDLFLPFNVTAATELTLTANQLKLGSNGHPVPVDIENIQLTNMQIRTFVLTTYPSGCCVGGASGSRGESEGTYKPKGRWEV